MTETHQKIKTIIQITAIIAVTISASGCPQLAEMLDGNSDNRAPLQNFTSAKELEKHIKDGIIRQYSNDYSYLREELILADSTEAAAPGSQKTANRTSTTNLQVSGVDESDRIKTDGRYLYIVQTPNYDTVTPLPVILSSDEGLPVTGIEPEPKKPLPHIRILEFSDDSFSATELSTFTLKRDEYITGSYLLTERANHNPDILIAIGQNQPPIMRDWFAAPTIWQSGSTTINIIEVDDPAEPALKTTLQFDGHLISSRRIDETLYLITRFNPYIEGYIAYPATAEEKDHNRKLLDKTGLDTLLPRWKSDNAAKSNFLSSADCYIAPTHDKRNSADIISIIAIDLTNPENRPNANCIVGQTETAYVSKDSIYLATTRYNYDIRTDKTEQAIIYPPKITTEIHKFSLTANGPQYRGSGVAEGHLGWEQDKKPFRMGENSGVLTIATSIGENWDETATTRLTLFREPETADSMKLTTVAQLPNEKRPESIGKPGERLYAARFIDNRAYLVTFRVIDPLYVIDLSDPTDPFIAGSLEIPGYSDYLHPVDDNLMLGLGKEAVADTSSEFGDGRGAWYQGLKLALFDISDPNDPREIQSLNIGQRGTHSEALVDHLAFTWLPADDDRRIPAQLALPIKLHGDTDGGIFDPEQPFRQAPWKHTGLYLFNIHNGRQNEAAAIEIQGKMIVERAGSEDNGYYGYGSTSGDRAVIRGDGIHYIHGDKVWSASWNDPKGTLTGPQ